MMAGIHWFLKNLIMSTNTWENNNMKKNKKRIYIPAPVIKVTVNEYGKITFG